MTFMDKVDSFLIKAEDKFNTLVGKKVVVNCIRLWIDKISWSERRMVMGKNEAKPIIRTFYLLYFIVMAEYLCFMFLIYIFFFMEW